MESLESLISPSLQEILRSLQFENIPNESTKKNRKRSNHVDDSGRKKRNRITFDATQIDEMEKVFAENQYPDATSRDQLANRIQLHEERVQIWFQNRRAKYRRELKHTTHPYEPPKKTEVPPAEDEAAQIISSIEAVINNAEEKSNTPPAKVDSPIVIENEDLSLGGELSSDLIDLCGGEHLSTTLSMLLNGSQPSSNSYPQSTTSENGDDVESDKQEEQINMEKAKLLMLTLSHLFNIQNETTS